MIFYDIGLLKTQNEYNDRKSLVYMYKYFIKKKKMTKTPTRTM